MAVLKFEALNTSTPRLVKNQYDTLRAKIPGGWIVLFRGEDDHFARVCGRGIEPRFFLFAGNMV
jgi:hypothetical protein